MAAFRGQNEVLELHEIAKRASLNKVTASRLLHTLESKGLAGVYKISIGFPGQPPGSLA
jgi:DNA-binding IclR family transcriptional regulator